MLIKNANIVKEKNNLKKVDILVEDGKIKKIEEPNRISSMFLLMLQIFGFARVC